MKDNIKFSIVIPAFNEAESLNILIPEISSIIKNINELIFELVLVDDASNDDSRLVIENFSKKHEFIKPIFLDNRSGQTGCFQAGFSVASGSYIIRMDSDLQDSPSDLPKFINAFIDGADMVMGVRECRRHKKIFRLLSYVYDFLVVLLFNSPLHANSGSFVGFRSDLVKNINFKKGDHRYLPLIALRRGAVNIREVFVRHGSRQYGESKYNPLKKLFFGFFEVWRLFFRLATGYYDKN